MGFKCPICHSDFGINKSEWKKHLQKCNDGLSLVFVKSIINISENKPNKRTKKNYQK